MNAKDLRRVAREKLSGRWGVSILVAFVVSLFGGMFPDSVRLPNFGVFSGNGIEGIYNDMSTLLPDGQLSQVVSILLPIVIPFVVAMAAVTFVWSVVKFILCGTFRQGYCSYLLKQHDGMAPTFKELFSQFSDFGRAFCLILLEGIFVFLWSLLFVIPGIIATYNYAMAPFVLLENPNIGAMDALKLSKEMMRGHRLEYFWLELTFLGWIILGCLSFGIGLFWVMPYMDASRAAFYRHVIQGQNSGVN